MAEGEVRQFFVRNEAGTVWGPLAPSTIELLLANGVMKGRLEVSEDGTAFAPPGDFPAVRELIPREKWGTGAQGSGPALAPPPPASVIAPPPPPAASAPPVIAPPPAAAAPPRPAPPSPASTAAPRPPPVLTPPTPAAANAPPPPGTAAAAPRAPAAAPTPSAPPAPGTAAPRAAPAGAPIAGPGTRAPGSTAPAGAAPPPGGPPKLTPSEPGAPRPAAPPPSPAAAAAPPRTTSSSAVPAAAPAEPAVELPPAEGELSELSPVRLYARAAAGDQSALLTLHLSDRVLELHFRRGAPEHVASSHPDDALGTFLVSAGLLSAAQVAQAEEARERFGGELVGALFGLGLLNPAVAFAQLAQRSQGLLLRALLAESGRFTFVPSELPAHKAMPLGNRWAVLSDLVRRIPTPELRRRLQPVLELPMLKSGGLVPVSDLRLTPQEVRALGFVDGVRSLAQLTQELPAEADHVLRLAFLLRELDAVSFAALPSRPARTATPPTGTAAAAPGAAPRPPPQASAPPPAQAAAPRPPPPAAAPRPAPAAAPRPPPAAAPPPAAPRPPPAAAAPAPAAARPGPPPPTLSPETELAQLRAYAATLKKQNHFERLELSEKTDASSVKVAYFKLAKLHHPDTLPAGAAAELQKLKSEVFGYIGEAYRTLLDDASRAQYLEVLQSGGEGEVDIGNILKAEELFQKGCILVKARKFPEAVEMLDQAILLNPDEPEFFAWRGYARFFTFADKKAGAAEASKDLQLTLSRNERCVPAHYFLGVIAKLCGDAAAAQKHFQRTVALQPDHIDAQRELRMAAQKK
ncbi:J domain-containing protein [Aggregicoccus sp. 17bor-14]|uniref:DnaJ domain-containing protein n=1 Tax=Myxococcaceae TaxID=31 RepID=UPI00129D1033|nr:MULTISPECIES: DnaJ domain-containing protein [Myxococcaceae]MBF5045093.1 DnaJ domain-containing protein [Simulacricoccus sp. 17bor-14]MRI90835.1 J domain-containing protein [Aggregicoccus sp. 17bor-14]